LKAIYGFLLTIDLGLLFEFLKGDDQTRPKVFNAVQIGAIWWLSHSVGVVFNEKIRARPNITGLFRNKP
jgi:hypothetical protein